MITPAEATALIAAHVPRLPIIPVALRDASGCVLQQSVRTERDQPPFDRISMDGIAISSGSAAREFRIAGTQAAGAPPLTLSDSNDCFEAMTGAIAPLGCDCVIPIERLIIDNGRARLAEDVVVAPWLNLHRRGVDSTAGTEVLRPGTILRAPEVAVLASAGVVHARVSRMPRIVVISTGDELVEPGQPCDAWQIHRSNVFAILASLRANGFDRVADDHIADDQAQLRRRLAQHLETADVLILSGGVSMGKFDFVPAILAELGVQQIFHKIAQRPGKPMWFGIRNQKTVYALPGNPVSTLACLARYVLPGLRIALGIEEQPDTVNLSDAIPALPSLTTLLPVRLDTSSGARSAQPQPTQGSGDFISLRGAHGCVELPPSPTPVAAGSLVKFYGW